MTESPTPLHLADDEAFDDIEGEPRSTPLSQLFHRVWSVAPERQDIIDVSPDDTVGDALAKMAEHDFSQLPVRAGQEVIGVFSYRSLARHAAEQVRLVPRTQLLHMPVDGFVDRAVFVSPYAELHELFDILDSEDAVFLGDERDLTCVVTTVDVLRWLHDLSEPFVRLGEIERSLREIVVRKLSPDVISECSHRSLSAKYDGRLEDLPTTVDAMTFDELRLVVIDGRNWPLLVPSLGRNLEMAKAKLAGLPRLRNDVFHFRRELDTADRERITTARQWLLGRLRMLGELGTE